MPVRYNEHFLGEGMRRIPVVSVKKLDLGPDGSIGSEIVLKDGSVISTTHQLRKPAKKSREIFLLEWCGNKHVPQGTMVGGISIWLTVNGRLMDENRKAVAFYERIIKYGGHSRKEQKILVYLPKS